MCKWCSCFLRIITEDQNHQVLLPLPCRLYWEAQLMGNRRYHPPSSHTPYLTTPANIMGPADLPICNQSRWKIFGNTDAALVLLTEGMSISKPSFLERWTLHLTPQELTGHTRWSKLGATSCHNWRCMVCKEHLYPGITAWYYNWGEGVSCEQWLNLARGHQCLGKLPCGESLPCRASWSPLMPSPMKQGNNDAFPVGLSRKLHEIMWDSLCEAGPQLMLAPLLHFCYSVFKAWINTSSVEREGELFIMSDST